MYRLTVVKLVPNPNYEKQLEEEKRRDINYPYGHGSNLTIMGLPSSFTEDRKLEVELTEEEYRKVKEAVIGGWEDVAQGIKDHFMGKKE